MLAKITLYEVFAAMFCAGQGYLIGGYILRGNCPLYFININKDTQFVSSAPREVLQQLQVETKQISCARCRPSLHSPMYRYGGLLIVQGELVGPLI